MPTIASRRRLKAASGQRWPSISRIEGGPAGGYRLRASNEGTAHLKLTGVSLPTPTGEVQIVSGPNYLLPGTERAWGFEARAPLPAGPVRLTVRAEDGTSSVVQADRIE